MIEFDPGDRVMINTGAQYRRMGIVSKLCSFEDYVRVDLDLKPKQKVQEKNVLLAKKVLFNMTKQKTPTVAAMLTEPPTPKVHTDALLRMVPTYLILPDRNQPRKFFDEVSQQELIESVKANGILQPILIRPNAGDQAGTYMLVCGERRYRAALEADIKEVPAVIRNLTDAEALELQIIENLQRKDVHPMEEAVAFKSLKDKFSVEELALRVGKSPKYVVQRMKLADLTDAWQSLLFADKITLSNSSKLARLSAESQIEIYKECEIPKDWQDKKNWTLYDYNLTRLLDSSTHDLSGAPFKTTDATLYPEMGACTKCPYNSANEPLLFDDLKKKRICSNNVCYQIKCTRGYKQGIETALQDPELLFIAGTTYPDDEEKAQLAAAKEAGATLLDNKLYDRWYREPEHPGTWHEFLAEQQKDYWDEETTEAEKKEALEEWKEEYEGFISEYTTRSAELEQAKAKGLLRKAFIVAGSDRGKIKVIKLEPAAAEASGGSSFDDVETEIAKIKQREKRNKELDSEKVYTEIKRVFNEGHNDWFSNSKRDCHLTQEEIIAVAVALWEAGDYTFKDWMKERYGLDKYTIKPEHLKAFAGLTELGINEMLLLFLPGKLVKGIGSPLTDGCAAAIYGVTKAYQPQGVAKAELEQMEKTEKRQANASKRIAALKKQKASSAS